MARRKRNASPHRGVWLEKPRGDVGWRACWVDPHSGKTVKMTLSRERYPDAAARVAFAKHKADTLVVQRLDRREGVVSMPVGDALKLYVAEHRAALRATTLAGYERVGEIFVGWCGEQRPPLTYARELTKVRLAQFRASRINKQSARDDGSIRSAVAINNELRALKTILIAWCRSDWCPELSKDTIADALRRLPQEQNEIEFLRPAQCQALLHAWVAVDAETFELTRREKRGKGTPGSTPKWPAMAHFVATLMLSGMRRGEALALRWGDVLLNEHSIVLRASSVKTKRGRRFDLGYSPALFAILHTLMRSLNPAKYSPELRVFPELSVDVVEAARKRMAKAYPSSDDAVPTKPAALKRWLEQIASGERFPGWDWQTLRRTCATVLCNMRSVGPFAESKALGHSVVVSERLYADRMRILDDVTTVEGALGIEDELTVIGAVLEKRHPPFLG